MYVSRTSASSSQSNVTWIVCLAYNTTFHLSSWVYATGLWCAAPVGLGRPTAAGLLLSMRCSVRGLAEATAAGCPENARPCSNFPETRQDFPGSAAFPRPPAVIEEHYGSSCVLMLCPPPWTLFQTNVARRQRRVWGGPPIQVEGAPVRRGGADPRRERWPRAGEGASFAPETLAHAGEHQPAPVQWHGPPPLPSGDAGGRQRLSADTQRGRICRDTTDREVRQKHALAARLCRGFSWSCWELTIPEQFAYRSSCRSIAEHDKRDAHVLCPLQDLLALCRVLTDTSSSVWSWCRAPFMFSTIVKATISTVVARRFPLSCRQRGRGEFGVRAAGHFSQERATSEQQWWRRLARNRMIILVRSCVHRSLPRVKSLLRSWSWFSHCARVRRLSRRTPSPTRWIFEHSKFWVIMGHHDLLCVSCKCAKRGRNFWRGFCCTFQCLQGYFWRCLDFYRDSRLCVAGII